MKRRLKQVAVGVAGWLVVALHSGCEPKVELPVERDVRIERFEARWKADEPGVVEYVLAVGVADGADVVGRALELVMEWGDEEVFHSREFLPRDGSIRPGYPVTLGSFTRGRPPRIAVAEKEVPGVLRVRAFSRDGAFDPDLGNNIREVRLEVDPRAPSWVEGLPTEGLTLVGVESLGDPRLAVYEDDRGHLWVIQSSLTSAPVTRLTLQDLDGARWADRVPQPDGGISEEDRQRQFDLYEAFQEPRAHGEGANGLTILWLRKPLTGVWLLTVSESEREGPQVSRNTVRITLPDERPGGE